MQAAKGLAKATGLDRVFMANSGTEANEGALKMARKYAVMQGHENRHEIISMNKAFHGRSMGALSVTGTANTESLLNRCYRVLHLLITTISRV